MYGCIESYLGIHESEYSKLFLCLVLWWNSKMGSMESSCPLFLMNPPILMKVYNTSVLVDTWIHASKWALNLMRTSSLVLLYSTCKKFIISISVIHRLQLWLVCRFPDLRSSLLFRGHKCCCSMPSFRKLHLYFIFSIPLSLSSKPYTISQRSSLNYFSYYPETNLLLMFLYRLMWLFYYYIRSNYSFDSFEQMMLLVLFILFLLGQIHPSYGWVDHLKHLRVWGIVWSCLQEGLEIFIEYHFTSFFLPRYLVVELADSAAYHESHIGCLLGGLWAY